MSVEFQDFSMNVKNAIGEKGDAFLYEAASLLEAQAKQLSPVDTGQLKGSWSYTVDTSKQEARVGSPLENGIWNELGTGEYALNGDGRKGGWAYEDEKGNYHFTHGKRPQRTLHKSFEAKKNTIIARAKMLFGGVSE